jgi:hypothetical protein
MGYENTARTSTLCQEREMLTLTPLLSKLFIIQSVKNSPPIGEVATDCHKKTS